MIKGDSRRRKISYYTQGVDDLQYERERSRPTEKQKEYFRRLIAKCKDNDIDVTLGRAMQTRMDYADGIDKLRERLEAAGILSPKEDGAWERVVIVEEDKEVGQFLRERLVPPEELQKKKPAVEYGMAAANRYRERVAK